MYIEVGYKYFYSNIVRAGKLSIIQTQWYCRQRIGACHDGLQLLGSWIYPPIAEPEKENSKRNHGEGFVIMYHLYSRTDFMKIYLLMYI